MVGGILYAIVEPWLRRARPWHGLAYGVGLASGDSASLVLDPFELRLRAFRPAAAQRGDVRGTLHVFGVTIAWLFDALTSAARRGGRARESVDILA